ncbi:MAG TPA: DUF488 domain-containing protein [Alphaproteobacteria bacterium]|nr:DUF488 domain-containing protein [Alphaproteobacteria bacterium]
MPKLYTIGHSTRTLNEFMAILHGYNITHLVDIRTIPKSRHVPWFNENKLKPALPKEGISYIHMLELGGLRHAHKDSINQGWHNASFRGFADYMQTPEFYSGLKKLNQMLKKDGNVAIMCAEAVPWRCHRSLIADAEIVHGISVFHIMSQTNAYAHKLTSFAVVDKKKRPIKVYYPLVK